MGPSSENNNLLVIFNYKYIFIVDYISLDHCIFFYFDDNSIELIEVVKKSLQVSNYKSYNISNFLLNYINYFLTNFKIPSIIKGNDYNLLIECSKIIEINNPNIFCDYIFNNYKYSNQKSLNIIFFQKNMLEKDKFVTELLELSSNLHISNYKINSPKIIYDNNFLDSIVKLDFSRSINMNLKLLEPNQLSNVANSSPPRIYNKEDSISLHNTFKIVYFINTKSYTIPYCSKFPMVIVDNTENNYAIKYFLSREKALGLFSWEYVIFNFLNTKYNTTVVFFFCILEEYIIHGVFKHTILSIQYTKISKCHNIIEFVYQVLQILEVKYKCSSSCVVINLSPIPLLSDVSKDCSYKIILEDRNYFLSCLDNIKIILPQKILFNAINFSNVYLTKKLFIFLVVINILILGGVLVDILGFYIIS